MSVDSFKQSIWEARLIANFHDISIADAITTAPSRVNGNKIIFNRTGAGNVKDYTGTVAWDSINLTPAEIDMAQKKYFAFALDDVDAAQLVASVIDSTTAEQSATLSEVIDAYVLGVAVKGAKKENVLGTTAAPIALATAAAAYENLVNLSTKLGKNKVPASNRFAIINNDYLNLLEKDDRFTRNVDVLANGVVNNAKINGMTVCISEEVGTGIALAMHKSAVGYGKQINSMEAMRLQSSFADGVRGLCVYDAAVLMSEGIAVLNYSIGA